MTRNSVLCPYKNSHMDSQFGLGDDMGWRMTCYSPDSNYFTKSCVQKFSHLQLMEALEWSKLSWKVDTRKGIESTIAPHVMFLIQTTVCFSKLKKNWNKKVIRIGNSIIDLNIMYGLTIALRPCSLPKQIIILAKSDLMIIFTWSILIAAWLGVSFWSILPFVSFCFSVLF